MHVGGSTDPPMSFAVEERVLRALRDWVFDARGLALLHRTVHPDEVPCIDTLRGALLEVVPGALVVSCGFYIGVRGKEEHTEWHCDAEAWFMGSTFGNVLIPLVQDEEKGSGMETLPEDALWDESWTLLDVASCVGERRVRLRAATKWASVVEVECTPAVLETRVGHAYCLNTTRPHRSLPRARRLTLFLGYVTVPRLRNPGVRPCDRAGFVDSVMACWQGQEEEDTQVVAERYISFWRARDKPAGSLWVDAWKELRERLL